MQSPAKNFSATWRERIAALHNIPPLMRLVWESARDIVAGDAASRIVSALIPLAMLGVSKRIFDVVQARFSGHPLPSYFWWLVLAELALAGLGGTLGRLTGYFDALLADRFSRHVSIRVMEHASRLDLAAYEDPAFYDKLERARVQATDRVGMVHAIGNVFQQLVIAASFCVGILGYYPWLLALLVISITPAVLGESYLAFEGYALSLGQTPARRQLDYLRLVGASKEAAKELKLFGLSGFITREFTRHSDRIYDENVALARRRFWLGSLLSLFGTAGYYGAYAFVVYKTVDGPLSLGAMVFLTGAIAGTSQNIQNIFSTASSIADQSLFLTDLVEFFKMRPAVRSKPAALPAPRPIRDGVVFEQVSFVYPGRRHPVLERLQLRFSPGERVALVGANGEGKTTLVKLLTRLYDPTAGRILLDGVDLRDYDLESLHRQIGVIFQDFFRFEMTARQNIAVGCLERSQPERVAGAARASRADAVIERLPGGYEQLLGRRFSGGVDLSGGEWQKLALARAYLREAQLLVLDEPTAALDARSEYELFQHFADLCAGKTALLISHRFSTVRMADRILVLARGQVAEEGNHKQLIGRGGQYAQMFEMQAAGYR